MSDVNSAVNNTVYMLSDYEESDDDDDYDEQTETDFQIHIPCIYNLFIFLKTEVL